jgi:site-specific DNA recombinase
MEIFKGIAHSDWEYLLPQKILRGAAYIRISDEKQEKNYSVAFQREKIITHFREQGVSIKQEHIFIDTYTGKVWRQRKNLQMALAAAKRHEFDILGMYKLDRLSREPDDQIILREQFQYYGVKIITLDPDERADDDSLAGDIIRRVYGWKAKLERLDVVQRTQDGLRQRVNEGKLLAGRRPLYGSMWNDPQNKAYYIIHIEHSAVVIRIFCLARDGMSLRSIAFLLTKEGIPTPDGKKLWRYQSIANILGNPFYIGRAHAYKTKTEFIPGEGDRTTHRKETEWVAIPDACPPIIDEETFYAVQEQLIINKQNSPRNNPHPTDTLLRCGMAICGSCLHNLGVDRSPHRGRIRVRYRCPRVRKGYKECKAAPDIEASVLDAWVWKEAISIIRNPEQLQANLDKQKTTDPTKDELTVIDGLLMDVASRIRNITETIETTPPSDGRDLLLYRLDELGAKKKSLEEQRDLLLREKINWADEQQALDDFKLWCAEKRESLTTDEVSYAEKRNALERLGLVVKVFPPSHTPRIQIETHPAGLRPSLGKYIFPAAHSSERLPAVV